MIISEDVSLQHLQLAGQFFLWHLDRKYLQHSLKVQLKKINLLKNEDVMQNPAMLDALIGVIREKYPRISEHSSTSVFTGTEPLPCTSAAA